MVGVGDHIDVLTKRVEYRKIVRGEAAKTARLLLRLVVGYLTLEALLAMSERRAPHVDEVLADDKLGRFGPVRIDRDLVRILIHFVGRSTALHAAKAEIRFVIDAPQFVGDQSPVAI